MIIHYNCTIGSILLHSFLLIYHPYPSSFHENSDDSRIKHVVDHLATLSIPTVRVEALEYS